MMMGTNPTQSHTGGEAAKPRAILTSKQAVAIFQQKLSSVKGTAPCAAAVARVYGVSEKAVRDIWKGRTWSDATLLLEPSRPARVAGPPGRPKGRKDSAPRRRRSSESAALAGEVSVEPSSEEPCLKHDAPRAHRRLQPARSACTETNASHGLPDVEDVDAEHAASVQLPQIRIPPAAKLLVGPCSQTGPATSLLAMAAAVATDVECGAGFSDPAMAAEATAAGHRQQSAEDAAAAAASVWWPGPRPPLATARTARASVNQQPRFGPGPQAWCRV